MTPVSYTVSPMTGEGTKPDLAIEAGIARAFVEARRSSRVLHEYPGPRPASLAEAYRIQDFALRYDGRPVAGWKVGRVPDPDVTALGSNRLAGPIFSDTVVLARPDEVATMAAFGGGFIAVEAEFMLRLRVPGHAVLPQDDAATLDWVDDVRTGMEIASSPYPGINDDGPCVTISDFGNNAGVLLGPPIPGWRTRDLRAIEVTTRISGLEAGRSDASGMLDGPLGSVRYLLANLESRGIRAQPGWWVSSGAVTGVHAAPIGALAEVHFAGLGSLACRLLAAGA